MTGQASLFDKGSPLVRHSDPPTSKLAADRLLVGPGQRQVLLALLRLGTASDKEIRESRECSGMGYGSSVKRRLDCQKYGWVEPAGVSSGRRMIVWRLTEKGKEEARS